MVHLGGGGAFQIRNRARHLECAVDAAGRPAELGGGGLQEAGGGGFQGDGLVDGLAVQGLVGAALAVDGVLAGGGAARADGGGGFAGGGVQQVVGGQGGYFDVQVDAVDQRAAEFALVTL